MPSLVVKSFAKKTGKSEAEVEKLWNEAKNIAKDEGHKEIDKNFYPIVVRILKKMLKLNEGSKMKTFKEFMNEKDEQENKLKKLVDLIYAYDNETFKNKKQIMKTYGTLLKDIVNGKYSYKEALDELGFFDGVHDENIKKIDVYIKSLLNEHINEGITIPDDFEGLKDDNKGSKMKALKEWYL